MRRYSPNAASTGSRAEGASAATPASALA